jgi:hypothetical protein
MNDRGRDGKSSWNGAGIDGARRTEEQIWLEKEW